MWPPRELRKRLMETGSRKNMSIQPAMPMGEGRVALIGGLLAGLGPLSLALFTPAMPIIADVFETSPALVKQTVSIYFAGFAVAQLLSGPLSDRLGRKVVIQSFLLVYVIGSIGTILAPTIGIMIWSRLLQGCGAAAGLVTSRAIVRDLFSGEHAARVLNVIAILLGTMPAIAPAVGSGVMLIGGWQAPFILMLMLGLLLLGVARFALAETRPTRASQAGSGGAVRDYGTILRNRTFTWPAISMAAAIATFYAQSTVMSFIVMRQLGYSAGSFGLLMLFVASGYFFGSIAARFLMPRLGAFTLVPIGLAILMLSTAGMAIMLAILPPNLVSVSVPVTLMMLSNAFVTPGLFAICLTPFRHMAGAAAAMSGFLTMGTGLCASLAVSFFSDPSKGLAVVEPILALVACVAFLIWRGRRSGPPAVSDSEIGA